MLHAKPGTVHLEYPPHLQVWPSKLRTLDWIDRNFVPSLTIPGKVPLASSSASVSSGALCLIGIGAQPLSEPPPSADATGMTRLARALARDLPKLFRPFRPRRSRSQAYHGTPLALLPSRPGGVNQARCLDVARSGRPGMSAPCLLLAGEADLLCSLGDLPALTRSGHRLSWKCRYRTASIASRAVGCVDLGDQGFALVFDANH
jgi:hypothetical protein